jgi:hypothetical protein
MLNRVYLPMMIDDLALCMQAQSGAQVDARNLAELLPMDRSRYASGAGAPPYICPALQLPTGAAQDEFLTLSTWPIGARLVNGVLSAAQEMFLLKAMCDLVLSAEGTSDYARVADVLHERVEDLAVHFSTAQIETRSARLGAGDDRFLIYRELVEDLAGPEVDAERVQQLAAVQRIEALSEASRFYGALLGAPGRT